MFRKNDLKSKGYVYITPEPVRMELRDVEKSFARLFSSDDGKRVLSHLQAITFQRALGARAVTKVCGIRKGSGRWWRRSCA